MYILHELRMYKVHELRMPVSVKTIENVSVGAMAADERRSSQRAVTHTACPRKLFFDCPHGKKYVKYIFAQK
jgi:hypothetical protein